MHTHEQSHLVIMTYVHIHSLNVNFTCLNTHTVRDTVYTHVLTAAMVSRLLYLLKV